MGQNTGLDTKIRLNLHLLVGGGSREGHTHSFSIWNIFPIFGRRESWLPFLSLFKKKRKKRENKQVEKQKGKNCFSLNQQESGENINFITRILSTWGPVGVGSFCHQKKEMDGASLYWPQFQPGTRKSVEACCLAPHNSLPHCLLSQWIA